MTGKSLTAVGVGAAVVMAAVATLAYLRGCDGKPKIRPDPSKINIEKSQNMQGNFYNNIINGDTVTIVNNIQKPPVQSTVKQQRTAKSSNIALNKPVVYMKFPLIDESFYYERYSVNLGNYPSNLTDGDLNTKAYPASRAFQYVIDLEGIYRIKKINLVWGDFGKCGKPIYITHWWLFSQNNLTGDKSMTGEDWTLVKSGQCPDGKQTLCELENAISARRFKVVAVSFDEKRQAFMNWIGMAEFEAYSA